MEKCCFKFETGYFRKCKLNVPRLFLVLLPGWKIYRSSIYIASVVHRDKKWFDLLEKFLSRKFSLTTFLGRSFFKCPLKNEMDNP